MKSERSLTKYRGLICLNCGHPLDISDKYCTNCGQLNSTKKLSFNDFFLEFFAGIFSYDSRMRRTLSTLIFRPGKISRDYISGMRTRYANPFRFFLSISIIFFIVFSLTNNSFDFRAPSEEAIKQQIEQIPEKDRKEILKNLEGTPLANGYDLDSIINNSATKEIKNYQDHYISQKQLDSLNFINSSTKQIDLYTVFYEQTKIIEPLEALDSLEHINKFWNRYLYRKAVDTQIIKNNPRIFFDYLISKSPFIIFFYLPVFALIIWLFYFYKPINYMEHLVFTFHVQSTFFVFVLIGLIVDLIFKTNVFTAIVLLLFLFYLYKALRNFYKEGRFVTIVKFMALNFIFLTLAVIAAIISALTFFAIR
ncbi:uncharacterized protein DUF3667 [Gillisia sp. Hel_I_86]|uniref:DUF3667 domain-containing protein n=1 Tax=Gillisia sp. Hel_I_86 TaxID=1249981 RepID=UPI001199D0EE|nr:DUF3667 domain-containing protein [Gillisia sp. Hel_I_86]TVZ27344.1 uncharacterized protein DUF3667 [Gillisia sp. Hel_I_86]